MYIIKELPEEPKNPCKGCELKANESCVGEVEGGCEYDEYLIQLAEYNRWKALTKDVDIDET